MDDLISRQAAIDALEKDIRRARSEDGELWVAKINAQMKLTLLPTIVSKRGKWIRDAENFGKYYCSECGFSHIPIGVPKHNFCPNCGSDNREVKE